MTASAVKPMDAAQFLAWAQLQENGRYELVRGEVVAMAPERAEHGRAKARIWRALAEGIARTGGSCEAFVDSLGVAVDNETVYEPDVLVNCGEALAGEALLAPAPVVIVEVLSPSSRSLDKSVKLADYFRLPSLIHYLVVDLARRLVLHYRREGETISVAIAREGGITLDPPGLALALADIFS